MKLTKYEHACIFLDNGQSRLVIDPGCFTTLPHELSGIDVLIITEEHADHFYVENVNKIVCANPNVKIFSTGAVAAELPSDIADVVAVQGEQSTSHAGYELKFYETPHAPIYRKSPCQSIAVKVDNYLYYPSDSYQTIGDTVEVLALPTSGPWLKVSETIDFANYVNSNKIIATHDGLYNSNGHAVIGRNIKTNISNIQREYIYLKPGETL